MSAIIINPASIEKDGPDTTTLEHLTSYASRPEAGYDTCILRCPPQLVRPKPETPGKDPSLQVMLARVAMMQAAQMGETLRLSVWWITRDPEVVKQRGLAHDCDVCREGVARALEAMEKNPGEVMAVGYLSWADMRERKSEPTEVPQ